MDHLLNRLKESKITSRLLRFKSIEQKTGNLLENLVEISREVLGPKSRYAIKRTQQKTVSYPESDDCVVGLEASKTASH